MKTIEPWEVIQVESKSYMIGYVPPRDSLGRPERGRCIFCCFGGTKNPGCSRKFAISGGCNSIIGGRNLRRYFIQI